LFFRAKLKALTEKWSNWKSMHLLKNMGTAIEQATFQRFDNPSDGTKKPVAGNEVTVTNV